VEQINYMFAVISQIRSGKVNTQQEQFDKSIFKTASASKTFHLFKDQITDEYAGYSAIYHLLREELQPGVSHPVFMTWLINSRYASKKTFAKHKKLIDRVSENHLSIFNGIAKRL
jgi:hypothetical protein